MKTGIVSTGIRMEVDEQGVITVIVIVRGRGVMIGATTDRLTLGKEEEEVGTDRDQDRREEPINPSPVSIPTLAGQT